MHPELARARCDSEVRAHAASFPPRPTHRLRLFRLLGLLCAIAAPVDATYAQDCASYDADGNGSITVADVAPLILEFELMRTCLGTGITRARECRDSDLNGNRRVDAEDVRFFDEFALTPFSVCWNADIALRPECRRFDFDRDGRVEYNDVAPLITFRERVSDCVGVDLAPLSCATADHDGDDWITMTDLAPTLHRLSAFETCYNRAGQGSMPGRRDLWIDRDRLRSLRVSGPAWERLWREATRPTEPPHLADPLDRADTHVLAQALAGIRLGDEALQASVRATLGRLVQEQSEAEADALAVARNVVGYVLAADLIELARVDPVLDAAFRERLAALRDRNLRGRTLRSTHEDRPNNWGTHAGAARVAIALYLGDDADLAAAAEVHRAWLGDRTARHADFRFGSLSWQADPNRPVGVNPRGARVSGIDVDGALPEEMRRGGSLAHPPNRTGYAWEALQGATVTTELLARNGYPDAWRWGDDAIERAVAHLYRLDAQFGGWAATGDDRWNIWLINRRTGRNDPAEVGVSMGKNMGFTDWTHAD